ncbi:MAG: PEGA domain-containing protein [Deltaproteobacteria bacterium]|nr:MAG: PEGA domain-containing protein [Deltaproteobacteria bacterium]
MTSAFLSGRGAWWLGGLALGLSLLAAPAVATAAAGDGPSSKEIDRAQRDYDRAVRLARSGKAREALELFEAALPVKNESSDIFYNLVQVAEVAKRWDKVLAYAQGFLRLEQETRDAKAFEAKLDTALKRLEKAGRTPVKVRFETAPEGVDLFVDHVPVAFDGAGEVLLLPGRHEAVARKHDHTPWRETIAVKAGEPQTLTVKLEPIVYTGTLKITTVPADGVTVYLDDKMLGTTPLEPLQLPTVKTLVRFEKPGYDRWVRYVTPERDQVYELNATLEKTP